MKILLLIMLIGINLILIICQEVKISELEDELFQEKLKNKYGKED